MDRNNLLNAILDCNKSSDKELIKTLESFISSNQPFNHEAENVTDACGLTGISPSITKTLKKEYSSPSAKVEAVERNFTKREIAFVLVMMNKFLDNGGKL